MWDFRFVCVLGSTRGMPVPPPPTSRPDLFLSRSHARANAVRILFWSLQPFIVRGMHVSLGVNFFLDTSPSFFFFSTYVILVIFWAGA